MPAPNARKGIPATQAALRARAQGRTAAAQRRAEAQRQAPEPAPSLIAESFIDEFAFAREMERDIRTIRRWRALRIGPAWVKVGRRILYSKTEILRYLEQATVRPCRTRRVR